MRRTGKDFESPTTGSEACGETGMTKEVAFMKGSDGLGEEIRVRIYAVALSDARVRGPVSRGCRRKTRRSARRDTADRHAAALDDLAALDHQDGVGPDPIAKAPELASGALLLRLEHDGIRSRFRGNGSALPPPCVACLKAPSAGLAFARHARATGSVGG